MLPAHPTPASAPTPSTSPSSSTPRQANPPWTTLIAALIMLYALGMGWGLIAGRIPPERANLLLAVPCLVPMIWNFAGGARGLNNDSEATDQHTGLLLSGAGWFLIALGFFLKHLAVMRDLPDAYAAQASTPLTPLSIAVGVLCLLIGAAVSYSAWQRDNE